MNCRSQESRIPSSRSSRETPRRSRMATPRRSRSRCRYFFYSKI